MKKALGTLLVALGASGWAYYAADTGGIIAARPVHVAFGIMFSLGWVALGLALQRSARTRELIAEQQSPFVNR